MIGKTIGQYRILELLGRGGMGDVYKAEDTRLLRLVALKFLAPHRLQDEDARARFMIEARSASALDHGNICTIYGVEETPDGQLFIAMGYYEGETVDVILLRDGSIPLDRAIDIADQVLEGLGRAHEKGIAHRDIKPANVVITDRGEAKLLDFGLATLKGQARITQEGLAIGTPAYMSPEQARGKTVDNRSDLWAVGVVLYEMVTGELPFDAGSAVSTLFSITQDPPRELTGLPTDQLLLLRPVIEKALAKDVDARYGDAEQMRADLEAVRLELARQRDPRAGDGPPSVAVLPFEDISEERDQEYFCTGIAEELVGALSKLSGLQVASRLSASRLLAQGLDVRGIGRRLGVATVLEGSVRRAGNRVRVSAQLTKAADGYALWSGRFDREMDDVLAIQEEIAEELAATLKGTLAADEREVLGQQRPTADPQAYRAYLEGRHQWNRRTETALQGGIGHFQEAIAADPDFARAYAGMADSWAILGVYGSSPPRELMPKARHAALKALELDDSLAEAFTSLALVRAVYDWDWRGAERDFSHAIALDPSYATARQWLAMNLLAPQRRFEEAEEQLRRAIELEPLSPAIATSLGLVYLYRRQIDRAVEQQLKALELDPDFAMTHFFLGQAYAEQARFDEARQQVERAVELSGGSADMAAMLAAIDAVSGNRQAAEDALASLLDEAGRDYVPATLVAQVCAALRYDDEALRWLRRAKDERAANLVWIGLHPAFEPLRGEPAFDAMLDGLGLS